MIYPQDFESRIGFDAIRADIASYIETDKAASFLNEVAFSSNYEYVRRQLLQTWQMLSIINGSRILGLDFPTRGYVDIAPIVASARAIGGFIEPGELVRLGVAIDMLSAIQAFFSQDGAQGEFDELQKLVASIGDYSNIGGQIRRIVDKFGVVRDGASPELATIRRQINERSAQISKRLLQILHTAKADGYADSDSSVSIRDGRAVIPVSASNKRKIKGFVFDESASGRTAYIEPLEVIELNNEVRELQNDERREVIRILITFADSLRPFVDDLSASGDTMCYFEFLIAKARYAHIIQGVLPILEREAGLYLRSARHPLLEKSFIAEGRQGELVPLDITLDKDKHILLISGPNAGGKSVCLKTVGLLQYMLQCGLLIPALENSEVGIFDSIFIDIGDQQSIEDDLSTYSSHLRNMKVILRDATCCSLVLIDEFGGGTEPNVGGAIAEAILERINERGVFGVITTHYANLKYFAADCAGIENGAMTFDVGKIEPLYRLEIGHSGSSFAFEIAHKIGLPEDVLQGARDRIGEDKLSLEKQLRQAMRDKRYWENKRDKIRLASKDVDGMVEQYQRELDDIKSSRAALIKDAKASAAAIVSGANAVIENTIRQIKESQANKDVTRAARAEVAVFKEMVVDDSCVDEAVDGKINLLRERERRRAAQSERRAQQKREVKSDIPKPKLLPLVVGARVRMVSGIEGDVLSINGAKATIAMGGISSVVPVSGLTVLSSSAKRVDGIRSNVSSSVLGAAMDFEREIDIRGMRVVEGVELAREFVDRAIVVGARRVRILHGKGTGALKIEVRRYLATEPMVSRVFDESEEFGGAGITIVEF